MAKDVEYYFEDLSGNFYTKDSKGRMRLCSSYPTPQSNLVCIICNTDKMTYYNNGVIHRDEYPAIIHDDGMEEYWLNGDLIKISNENQIDNTVIDSYSLDGIKLTYFTLQTFLAR